MHDHNAHTPGGHRHTHGSSDEHALALAAVLTGSFMLVEVFGGVIAGSLALLADAGHMLTDFASLVLAWWAFRMARKPASEARTYGHHRLSVLAAFVNGLALFVVAAWVCVEAWHRLGEPAEIAGPLMLGVAVMGLMVNIVAFWILSRSTTNNLNLRAAALHVAGDLLGSIAAIIAAVIIILTGWTPIDPLLSVVVALIILRSAYFVIKESGHILLEGAPDGFDRHAVATLLKARVPGVSRVGHIHAWSITQEKTMATLEVDVSDEANHNEVCTLIKALMLDQFGIAHTTVQTHSGQSERTTDSDCTVD